MATITASVQPRAKKRLLLALVAGAGTTCAVVAAVLWQTSGSDTSESAPALVPAAQEAPILGGMAEQWSVQQPSLPESTEPQPRGGLAETWAQQEGEQALPKYPDAPNFVPGAP